MTNVRLSRNELKGVFVKVIPKIFLTHPPFVKQWACPRTVTIVISG